MNIWPVQDAKARFSEMLDRCVADGAQIVTRRGERKAVLVPFADWERMKAAAKPSLKDLLLDPVGRGELALRDRGRARRREVHDLQVG